MANEVLYSGQGDTALAEIAADRFLLLAAAREILGNHPALFYAGDLSGSMSATVQIPQVGWEGYNLAGDAGENSSTANTAFTDASTSLSVAQKAVMYNVSELLRITGGDLGLLTKAEHLARNALMVQQIKLTDMIVNVIDGFAATAGTSGVDLSLNDIEVAQRQLQENGVTGQLLCILHPIQWQDLRRDLRGESALQMSVNEIYKNGAPAGYQTSWQNIDFFVSSRVPTANGGADRAGALFGYGAVAWADASFPQDDIVKDGVINLGKVKVQVQDDLPSAMRKTLFSCYLAVGLGVDSLGVSIISDA